MSADENDTKALLESLVSELYTAASREKGKGSAIRNNGNFLEAADGQFLGEISPDRYNPDSILNQYGPYGSRYSGTSIFNAYCPYGGQYGRFSPENPYTTSPPRLVIGGGEIGVVSVNSYVPNRIPFSEFIYSLNNDIAGLLGGKVSRDDVAIHRKSGDAFIQASDGTFLGSLNPNRLDVKSIFNRYGEYGNKYSSKSIFNKFATYGSRYSPYSPYNPTSRVPPEIIVGGKKVASLSVNASIAPRISPDEILTWAENNVKKSFG